MIALAEAWKELCPGYELKYQFYDEWLDSMYKGEEKLAAAIRLFSILAILISCLGIIGLAEFSLKKRIKEMRPKTPNLKTKVSRIKIQMRKINQRRQCS